MKFKRTRKAISITAASVLLAAGLVVGGPADSAATAFTAPAVVKSVRSIESAQPVRVKQVSRSKARVETPKAVKKIKVKKIKKVEKRKTSNVKSIASNSGANRRLGRAMAAKRGWTGNQWTCLNNLWTKESGWSTKSTSPSGKHHGIPQLKSESLRGASAEYQIKRGLEYIKQRPAYGNPCAAWRHFQSHNWY
jgi:resuscitation-promoting factor RpfB